ncbi:hypothetical protein ACIQMR_35525 [Streptomyces sp. NPDC091376]
MNRIAQRWAVVAGGQGNKDIEDGDGGGSNPPIGCPDDIFIG